MHISSSKSVAFIALMAALGNVLSFLSIQLAPILPNVPVGPISVSLAIDLSHLATFIAAIVGGPYIGGLSGGIGGLIAAFEFGFSKGNLITGIGLPLGKALTGIAAGYIFRYKFRRSIMYPALTSVAYIPEAIFTAILFIYGFPLLVGLPREIASLIAIQIIGKAFIEMILIGVILMGLHRNDGFTIARNLIKAK